MRDWPSAPDERSARSAEAQLTALLDAAVDAIVLIDASGRIQAFNPAAERLFGYRASEVLGRNVGMLMPEPDRSRHDDYIRHYRETGEARIIGIGREVTARRRDGGEFPIDLSVGEIQDENGPARFVGIMRDISRRQRAEEEAAAHRETLAHLSRLNTMSELCTGLAHEINQPLAAISASARAGRRMLDNDPDDLDAIGDALDHISRQAERAGDVVRQLRSMVGRRHSAGEAVTCQEMLDKLQPLAEIDARQLGLEIEWDLPPDSPTVEVDPIQIQQVVINLLHNAVQSMADGGEPRTIRVSVARLDDSQVEVRVRDHGHGLRGTEGTELMEPFVGSRSGGLGVGLSICRSIVAAHSGELTLADAEGAGAEARFTLPLANHE